MSSGAWRKLLSSERDLANAIVTFEKAIAKSFESHPMQNGVMTRDEVKRRFNICAQIFETLRADLKWGLTRIFDHMPHYLRAELNGESWKPDARTIWTPTDGA